VPDWIMIAPILAAPVGKSSVLKSASILDVGIALSSGPTSPLAIFSMTLGFHPTRTPPRDLRR